LSGLTRSDWGAYWNHSQRLDPLTTSYFYVDYPEHRGLYGTSNIRRQFRNGYSLGLNANETINPAYNGYSSSSSMLSAFLAAPGRRLGKSPVSMVTSVSWNQGIINSKTPTGSQSTQVSTQGADIRFFTPTVHPDKKTNITNSLAVGGSYSRLTGQSSYTLQGNIGAVRTLSNQGSLTFNYNYTYDPLHNYAPAAPTYGGYTYINSPLQQTFSLTGGFIPNKKSTLSVTTNYSLPNKQMSGFAFYNYQVNNDWGIGMNALYQQAFNTRFSSLEFSLTRRIFGRTIMFTYGTDTHRIRFDFGAGQF